MRFDDEKIAAELSKKYPDIKTAEDVIRERGEALNRLRLLLSLNGDAGLAAIAEEELLRLLAIAMHKRVQRGE